MTIQSIYTTMLYKQVLWPRHACRLAGTPAGTLPWLACCVLTVQWHVSHEIARKQA